MASSTVLSFLTTAPGRVPPLNITVINPMEAIVSWSPVDEELANGVIQLYRFSLREYGGAELSNGSLNVTEKPEARFSGLGKY